MKLLVSGSKERTLMLMVGFCFSKRDLFGLDGIIYSTHIECGFVFNVVAHALFAVFRFV